ncbi:hermansky-Pudlak syndrome 3 [Trichonephila inaurata madagascariensis]|uniref:Hermansky-Pudlak syndrome 3 n=1 Tax=Trichonephila inaurata madagascariensis TaxID=2747483 RepID=A0A8X7C7Q7_9ARAC|nr:hermansky-Pudlak syndrome 3 [Trichonephila inaurata madagascariensis]
MVRVVSCHHFVSQDVFLSENEPTAFCGAQDKLLVSTVQHAVNVHDLEARGNVLHSFPTIDIVKQIIYCESGNYVATIENKVSWHRSLVSYVRIYFKWWIDANNQPFKVRVAGCAPVCDNSHSSSKSLEMIELPLEKPALCISACNKTSALAVSLGNIISVFCYSTKIHSTLNQTFNDFDHFVDISIPLIAQNLDICENYFACMSDKAILVFKISGESDDGNGQETTNLTIESVDSEICDENFVEWRFESCTNSGASDKVWDEHLKSKLHPKSFPINLHFHAIDKENEIFSSTDACEFHGPLLTIRGCSVDVRLDSKTFEMFPGMHSNIYAVTLLFRQFAVQGNDTKLSALQFVPFYKSETVQEGLTDPLNVAASKLENSTFSLPWLNLTSSFVSSLKAMGCFFSTLKEGFLYDLTNRTQFVNSYNYTSTLKGVILDTSLLHALTETGLETYTVHLPHSVLLTLENIDEKKNIVPKYEDAVCLLGLRPFLGVDHLVKSDNHLVLVSSVEDSVSNTEPDGGNRSTLYSLKEPASSQVFSDLLEVAESQKSTSPSTYYHLLSEAHMILRTQIFFEKQDKEIETLYEKSCLMLGDYFLCYDSMQKLHSIPYYQISQLSPENIVKRILDFRHQLKLAGIFQSLVFYMNSILFDKDPLPLSLSQSSADSILSAYSEEAPEMLWKVILCSNFEGYKLDKAILILKRRLTNKRHPLSPISNAADTTALVYLLLQKSNVEAAQNMVISLAKADLLTIMASIDSKIWDGMNLTNFGKFLKQTRPDAFIELLLSHIDTKKFQVSEVLQILQSESPNTDLHLVHLLKGFLEAILSDKSMSKQVDSSVLNLLVKIYLKRLLAPKEKSMQSTPNALSNSIGSFTLFFGSRATWLNEMPPFNDKSMSKQVDSSVLNLLVKIYLKRLLAPKEKSMQSTPNALSNSIGSFTLFFGSRATWLNEMPPFNGKGISRNCLLSPKIENKKTAVTDLGACCCWNCNEDLLRLQSLLSYLGPSEDIKGLVLDFLCSAKDQIPNWLSIEIMCSNEARAIKLLIGMAPKALLPYATDTFKDNNRKWSMLFTFLYEHMQNIPDDHPNVEIYSQTFHAVLRHLAEHLNPEELLALLPHGENPLFLPHVRRCVEKHQAEQLKIKIVSLGQEIKSMMLC